MTSSWLPPGDGLPEVSSFGLHYFKGGLQVGVASGRPWPAREVPSGSRARFRWPVYVLANDVSLIAETKKAFMVRRGGKAYCSIEKLLG